MRDDDWKLIEWYEDNHLELFNVRQDPGEHRNLASAKLDKAKELQAKLAAWRKSVNALMPTPNPDFDGKHAAAPKARKKREQ